MSDVHRIFGAEVSPYSVKVRSYLRYKGIPHRWIVRSLATQAEFQKYAKLPLIPLVVTPEERGLQDSTPILETLEARHPKPALQPEDPTLAFLSTLLEEFADEWGNKWMFHYRWARKVDQDSAAERIAKTMAPGLAGAELAKMAAGVAQRMVERVWFVGSSEATAPRIEASYREALELLEKHLAAHPYLFGQRPALADFGLSGQLFCCSTDPTPGRILREHAPSVAAWVERMLSPGTANGFATWESLAATLEPLLARQVGRLFLPWSDANARAIAAGREEFSVTLDGAPWTQKPQKYHAKSLAELRRKYAAASPNAALDAILERTGCLRWLRPAS